MVSAAAARRLAEKALYERWVQGRKVDGITVNRTRLQELLACAIFDRTKNSICFAGALPTFQWNLWAWKRNSNQGMIELIAYLANQGHSRIAYIGASPTFKLEY